MPWDLEKFPASSSFEYSLLAKHRGVTFPTVSSMQALGLIKIPIALCELSCHSFLSPLYWVGSGTWKNFKLSPRFRV